MTDIDSQERAYIAASRRSDRSVEARVESARRASEIHKRRTGKSLKVTEKDVLAEEMYEEEEDELPSQYKNLNAHLQTGSLDFDARLQAYLANAVAFRKALSGVAKNRDKSKNVDFVNTRQLADHEALFPKHSDAWKDIIIPKSSDTSSSPFLPQGTSIRDAKRYDTAPYDTKSSGLTNRRMSANLSNNNSLDSIGTLRQSDLKERTVRYRQTSRHPSLPQPGVVRPEHAVMSNKVEDAGINYANLDLGIADLSPTNSNELDSSSPFSSKLPANALDMLMPYMPYNSQRPVDPYYNLNSTDSPFHTKPQDTIDATLLAPASDKAMMPYVSDEYAPQSQAALWQQSQNQIKESSASRKLVEDNMRGNFINDAHTEAWDWSNTV